MTSIIPNGQFNPLGLSASGFYIVLQNPPSYIRGVPSDVVGAVGTASYGPVNTPVHCGSGQDVQLNFGPITTASLTDPYDLPTDAQQCFLQSASQASLEGWFVRVTDGTDTQANVILSGTATGPQEQATIGGTITAGDVVTLIATSTSLAGSPVHYSYTVKSGDTVNSIAAGLLAVINTSTAASAGQLWATISTLSPQILHIWPTSSISVAWTSTVTGSSTETVTLVSGSTQTTSGHIYAKCTGSGGDNITINISAGVQTNTLNVSITPPFGGASEIFPNLPTVGFWQALSNAINNGVSAARGPSAIVYMSTNTFINTVGAPSVGSYSLAGGTDGRSGVGTATLIGSDTTMPKTGLYALRSLNPGVGIVWLVGCTDQASIPTLVAFGQSESCKVNYSFPSNTSSATALAAVASIGAADPSLDYLKDWVYIYDTVNKQTRLIPPSSTYSGMWATYGPQNSPDNKPVNGILGTDRRPPSGPYQPYSLSEIGQLQNAGICVITNPCNAGQFWGTWGGRSTSPDPATVPAEYWRLTTYLSRSLATFGGKYVGQLQSQQPVDPLRSKIKTELNQYMQNLVGAGIIDAGTALCEFSSASNAVPGNGLNTPTSISQHYLYAMCIITYLSSVWYFILTLEGGTTVNVQIVQQQATAS